MTIHSDHPFADPPSQRDPVRRLRGRLGAGVTLLTAGHGDGPLDRAGLTVTSMMVGNGDPAHALALIDPESDLMDTLHEHRTAVVNLLAWEHRGLAEAFAGLTPTPGERFPGQDWVETAWGPALGTSRAWAGVRLAAEPRTVGWSLLVDTEIEHVEILAERPALWHSRGTFVEGSAP